MAKAEPAPGNFVREDDAGPYVRCTHLVIEGDQGRICGGKQRPHPASDGRRWVCPDCGAETTQRGDR